jgi:two-component system NarL family sensor kinase
MKLPSIYLSDKSQKTSLIVGLFILVLGLELTTTIAYVIGYLYTAPILLTNTYLGTKATIRVTILAILLTMLNLWIPGYEQLTNSVIINRLIAVISLLVTGLLAQKENFAREEITRQTAQLQARDQLMILQEDFASTLTHDLKTPLLGAIEILKAYQKEQFGVVNPSQHKILATMIRGHENSLQLVETLLDVYRNDRAGLQLNLIPLNLAPLIEEIITNFAPLAILSQVYLSLNYGQSDFRQSPTIYGDPWQLKRVLTNLIVNAIDHSRRNSRIEISLESQISYQIVKIMDNGAGITGEELPHLFERFYQGNSDRQARGTGLGLYLSRQIIEAHGGTIWAENRENTRGAIFAFRLPIYRSV